MGGCAARRRHARAGRRRCSRYNARPPDPAVVGERWREHVARAARARRRLRRGTGSAPAPRRVLEARLGVRGLRRDRVPGATRSAAGPTATATRSCALLAGLAGPRKGLIGPWAHIYPARRRAGPGDRLPPGVPALVGPLAQGRRHRDHGRADAARLDAGVGRAAARSTRARPGRWVAEPAWPSPRDRDAALALGAGGSRRADAAEAALRSGRRETLGPRRRAPGAPTGVAGDAPPDQRAEDGRSLCFDSEPLDRAARAPRLAGGRARRSSADRPRRARRRRACATSPRTASSTLVTPRRSQPHAPRQPRAPRRRSSPAERYERRASSSTRSRTPSRRATGSASRSRRPTGRGLAVAGAGDADARGRGQPPRAARAAAATGGRRLRPFAEPRRARRRSGRACRAFRARGERACAATSLAAGTRLVVRDHRDDSAGASRDGHRGRAADADTYSIVEGDPLSATARGGSTTSSGAATGARASRREHDDGIGGGFLVTDTARGVRRRAPRVRRAPRSARSRATCMSDERAW